MEETDGPGRALRQHGQPGSHELFHGIQQLSQIEPGRKSSRAASLLAIRKLRELGDSVAVLPSAPMYRSAAQLLTFLNFSPIKKHTYRRRKLL
jgi:hypothetical protein